MDSKRIQQFKWFLIHNKLPSEIEAMSNSTKARFRKQAQKYSILDNKLISNATGHPVVSNEEGNVDTHIERLFKNVPQGPRKIYDSQLKNTGITRKQVEDYIWKQEEWQIHRPASHSKAIKSIISNGYGNRFQADLIDMRKYQHLNLGYKWILTVIDCYSKKAWAFPMKNKNKETVRNTIAPLLRSEVPLILHTDNGPEFKNDLMAELCEDTGTRQIFGEAYNPKSQGQIERFNRTLKSMIWRHFTLYSTKIWKDALNEFINTYNNTIHSSTQAKPITQTRKIEPKPLPQGKSIYREPKVGNLVRLSLETDPQYRKKIFKKHYTPN